MMELNKKKVLFIIMYSTITIAVLLYGEATLTQWHEEAHHQIYAEFGVNSVIQYSNLGAAGNTTPNVTQFSRMDGTNKSIVQALQSENEIVGYQVMGAYQIIMILQFIVVVFIIMTK